MANEKNAALAPFVRELFQLQVYKRSQGRVTRQVTFAILAVTVSLGCWRLFETLIGQDRAVQYAVPGVLMLLGWWIAFRLVNLPAFADFLIQVEAEMNKVSWPNTHELIRSSLVVIFCIFFLAAVLLGYDLFWRTLLELLKVVRAQ